MGGQYQIGPWFGSGQELLESPCECGIEPPGSISHGVKIYIDKETNWRNQEKGEEELDFRRNVESTLRTVEMQQGWFIPA